MLRIAMHWAARAHFRLVPLLLLATGYARGADSTVSPEPPLRRPWRVGVHGGWWDVGADLLTPVGAFVGLGIPWVVLTPAFAYSGQEGVVTADLRLGYGRALSERVTLYGHLLTGWALTWGDPCGEGCTSNEHKLFFFPSAGARYRWPSGVMVGADVPLLGARVTHHDDREAAWSGPKWFPPPISFAFSQAYLGYEW